ncbi:MAG: TraR/DksA family transcriptional regulator [Methylococcaceae bacterium]|nr:TraR/DksA family transcriptional regulator [Methylococcaceae bacterium]
MSAYKDVRMQLTDLLNELEPRLDKIKDNVTHANEALSADFAEQATEMENSEVVDCLGNATREEIVQIKQAINRVDNDEFGFCLSCGVEILPERLAILPFTKFCINCAQKKENA